MIGGGKMAVDMDEQRGRAVGSQIRMGGSMLGVEISLDEVVTVHDRPIRKEWALVRVFIDYELPSGSVAHKLGRLFGSVYAKWCVDQMLDGVVQRCRTSTEATLGAPSH